MLFNWRQTRKKLHKIWHHHRFHLNQTDLIKCIDSQWKFNIDSIIKQLSFFDSAGNATPLCFYHIWSAPWPNRRHKQVSLICHFMSTLHDDINWASLIFVKAFFMDVSLKPTIKWFSVVKHKTATKLRQSRSWETMIRFPVRSDEEVTSNMAIVHGSQKYLLIFLLSIEILLVDLLNNQRPKKV